MGGLSLIKKETIYFKFQPVIFSVLFGIFMLYSYFAETNFFLVAIEKYKSFIPVDKHFVWEIPEVRQALINLPLVFGFGLFVHAIVVCVCAALKLSNWWWILCRAVGFILYFLFPGSSHLKCKKKGISEEASFNNSMYRNNSLRRKCCSSNHSIHHIHILQHMFSMGHQQRQLMD